MNLDEAIKVSELVKKADANGFIGFRKAECGVQMWRDQFSKWSDGFNVKEREFDDCTKELSFEYNGVVFFTLIEKESDSNE